MHSSRNPKKKEEKEKWKKEKKEEIKTKDNKNETLSQDPYWKSHLPPIVHDLV